MLTSSGPSGLEEGFLAGGGCWSVLAGESPCPPRVLSRGDCVEARKWQPWKTIAGLTMLFFLLD